MPPLDLPRLRRDLKRRLDARPHGHGPNGRVGTGSMAIVRAHLETFEQMHRDGASWVDIAAGLAAQGVTQGVGDAARPITARRLTALMASVRRERERHARAGRTRTRRGDLTPGGSPPPNEPGPAPRQPPTASESVPLALAQELAPRDHVEAEPDIPTAEDIRRSALAGVQKLLKKDPP